MRPGDTLLIDSNLLVLLIVGTVALDYVGRHRRTKKYDADDYNLLMGFTTNYRAFMTTPHVLAETSNLLGSFRGSHLERSRRLLRERIEVWNEEEAPAKSVVQDEAFARLGLTDAGICQLVEDHIEVVTDDLDLYLELSRRGAVAHNFTHLQMQGVVD